MEKVRLVVHTQEADKALEVLQRSGAAAFIESSETDLAQAQVVFPYANLLPRIQHAVAFLEPYATKKSLWHTLREGSLAELSEVEVQKHATNTDVVAAVVDDVEHLQVEFADASEAVRRLEEAHAALAHWKALPVTLGQLRTAQTQTLLLQSENEKEPLQSRLTNALADTNIAYELFSISAKQVGLVVSHATAVSPELLTAIQETGSSSVPVPPGSEAVDVELTKVEEQLAAARGEVARLHDMAEHVSHTHLRQLQIAGEVLSWQKERYAVSDAAVATVSTLVYDGWLRSDAREAVERSFVTAAPTATFVQLEMMEDEQPPVELKNSSFIEPFEVVTRLYGMPGYRDLDPTVFLAGFFFVFFGLSLTDVGYGAFLMLVSLFLLFFTKVPRFIMVFAKLLFFMGLSSFLIGLIFGGYLGIAPESLPQVLRDIQVFDPIGNPLPVFYLALGLGVFQVMVGMVLKIYSEARNNRLVEGLLDQGPWLLMFCLGILYVATVTGYVALLPTTTIINLVYVGIALIVLASGRKGDTVLQKVQSAALSLYDSIGYFSDILSYSRLLALGLATTALAFAVNLIADIVRESAPYVGPVLAIAVLVIGHLFTLAVNTLGAFIHSARLQFVEFFGKFIGGTGQTFAPLKRSERHVVVVDK